MRTVLLVFAKAPVPGRVKTRLAAAWGARGACHWYRRLLAGTVATAAASGASRVELWCAPGRAHPGLRSLAVRHGLALRVQPSGDLGRRMRVAILRSLRQADGVIIIGGDCTPLRVEHIDAAVAALNNGSDLVLGPASDGGYVLIGARRAPARVFRAVDWGSGRVLRQTRTRLRGAGLAVTELATSWDVDHPADVRRLLREGGVSRWGRP